MVFRPFLLVVPFLLASISHRSLTDRKGEILKTSHVPKILTTDLDNFWAAYDLLSPSADSVYLIQKYYLDKASPEFRKFLKLRNFTADEYVRSIRKVPAFWKSIRPLTEKIKLRKKELMPFFAKIKEAYPPFREPDVCFAIGTIKTGGTTDEGLILIGAEIAAADSTVVKSEFQDHDFMKAVLGNTGDIIGMVAHETIHTQQLEVNENESLLKQAITEGGADFLATLLLGKMTMNSATFQYGSKHEKALWKEFYNDVNLGKTITNTDWFYKYQSNRPPDLGYFIGYKITEFYYNMSKDKKLAIKSIIEMDNSLQFLKKSKYQEKFTD